MFRNRFNLPENSQAVNDFRFGPAARECLHCGDFFTAGGELWGCTGRTDGSLLHELRPAGDFEQPTDAARELPADFYDVRDEATHYLLAAAENLRLAAALVAERSPQVAYRLEIPLQLEARRLKGLGNVLAEAYGTAALEAAIIAGSVDDKIHYHSPELTSAEDSPDPVAEARSSSSAS